MTPPRGLSQNKLETIINASMAECTEQGFTVTSTDQIAVRASVFKRTVYNHFHSKEELFHTITVEMWQRMAAATELDSGAS